MTTDIGVGTFVEYVGPSNTWYKTGHVDVITAFTQYDAPCDFCRNRGGGFWVASDPPSTRHLGCWCPCQWRPFHGTEQEPRRVCETVDA